METIFVTISYWFYMSNPRPHIDRSLVHWAALFVFFSLKPQSIKLILLRVRIPNDLATYDQPGQGHW